MNEEYVEEDNIKVLLTDYSNWIATITFVICFDEDLRSNSTLKLNTTTLNHYLSKVILMLKEKFLNHCAWLEPKWIKRMSGEEFENKGKHEKGRGNVDVSEDTKNEL